METRLRSYEKVAAWLQPQPIPVSSVIAARAALRALPMYFGGKVPEADAAPRDESLLATFRALAAAFAFNVGPIDSKLSRGIARASLAVDAAARKFESNSAARSLVYAASLAASIADRNSAKPASEWAAGAVRSAGLACALSFKSEDGVFGFYDALNDDVEALERGVTTTALAQQPLWKTRNLDSWLDFESALLGRNQHWEVWTDWYRSRMRGDSASSTIESARLCELPESAWNDEPAVVNRALLDVIGRAAQLPKDIPSQSPVGIIFTETPGEAIDIDAQASTAHGALQITLFRELQRKVLDALHAIPQGSNTLNAEEKMLSALGAAVEPSPHDVDIYLLWSCINSLRRRRLADDRNRGATDKDSPPWPEDFRAQIDDVVDTGNALLAGDEIGRQLDRQSADPKATANELSIIEEFVSRLRLAKDVITQRAGERLEEAIRKAATTGDAESYPAQLEVSFAKNSVLNALVALLRSAFLQTTKTAAGAVVGTAAVGAVGLYVANNAAFLHQLVAANGNMQALHSLIDFVARVFL